MNKETRAKIIRQGNKYLNENKIKLAEKEFIKSNYKSGLIRVADHYLYKLNKPINALPLYLKCKEKEKSNLIYKILAKAISKVVNTEKKEKENKVKNEIIKKTKKNKINFSSKKKE